MTDSNDSPRSIAELQAVLRDFVAERDWEQFHSPKNLAMALIAEAGELVEEFQWLSEEQSAYLEERKLSAVTEEVADVFIYLARLADVLEIDLLTSVAAKIELNRKKYPAEAVRGLAKKYTEYD